MGPSGPDSGNRHSYRPQDACGLRFAPEYFHGILSGIATYRVSANSGCHLRTAFGNHPGADRKDGKVA